MRGGATMRSSQWLKLLSPRPSIDAEVLIEGGGGEIRPGMLGVAKIHAGRRSIATLLLRKPARWLWSKIWPLLP